MTFRSTLEDGGGPIAARPPSLRALAVVLGIIGVATALAVVLGIIGVATALAAPAAQGAGFEGPRGLYAAALDSILGPDLDSAQIGLLAISEARQDTLVAYRAGRRLIPGSNAKLFPTGALLALHGPGARRVTTLEARGKVKRSGKKDQPPAIEFKGDLTLHPCGMPDILPLRSPGTRGLVDTLAYLLRASGLSKFEGTLYVDRTLFAAEPTPPGWGADDVAFGYGAPVTPALVNGNAALVTARESNGTIQLTIDPPDAPITVRAGGISIGDPGLAGGLTPRWATGARVIELSGTVPRGGEVKRSVALSDPDSAAAVLLLAAMRRQGIEVKKVALGFLLPGAPGSGPMGPDAWRGVEWGDNRAWRGEATAAGWDSVSGSHGANVVALASPSLVEAISVVNPQSLNVEAEGLLRLVSPAGWAKSRREGISQIYRLADQQGIDTLDLSLVDGSGLSPQDLVTARAMVRWLQVNRGSEVPPGAQGLAGSGIRDGSGLRVTLATPGQPGTLEKRFLSLPAGAELHAKTGTLSNVSSISGYLRTAEGEDLIFTMIVNGARRSVASVRDAEDRLVSFLARAPMRRGPPFRPYVWGRP